MKTEKIPLFARGKNHRNAKIRNDILMKIVNRGMEQRFKSHIHNVPTHSNPTSESI